MARSSMCVGEAVLGTWRLILTKPNVGPSRTRPLLPKFPPGDPAEDAHSGRTLGKNERLTPQADGHTMGCGRREHDCIRSLSPPTAHVGSVVASGLGTATCFV